MTEIMTTLPSAGIDEQQSERINRITGQILNYKAVMGVTIVEIGRLLSEARETLPRGAWGGWLREKVDFSERSAQNFMRIWREYGQSNPQLVADLGLRKALALLDLPAEERADFAAEHDAAALTARELEQAVRERNEARADLEAKDAALRFANERLDGLSAELSAARREAEELRSRPVEVAVEPVRDEAAIRKAAREAAREAKAKAEAKAAQSVQEAEARAKALEAQLEEARNAGNAQRAEDAEARVQVLEKELAAARNEDVMQVQLCFEQIKELANRMTGHILRLQRRGCEEECRRCRNAQRVLGEAMVQAAGEIGSC